MQSSAARVAIVASVFACWSAQPAQALIKRVWVSGKGADSLSCGPVGTPCRTPQFAHDNILAPGGEIDILDPAGYGTLTITKSLSLVNDGVGTAGFLLTGSVGPVISIAAGPTDSVHIRGLNIEGLGTSSSGISLTSAGSLSIVNCVIRHFAGSGVSVTPASGATAISITTSEISDNGGAGVSIAPTGTGVVNGIVKTVNATNNLGRGIDVAANGASASVNVSIVASTASNNKQGGVLVASAGGATVASQVRDATASNNTGAGFSVTGGTLRIAHSVASGNSGFGFLASGGIGQTYGDNDVNGNAGGDVSGFTPVAKR